MLDRIRGNSVHKRLIAIHLAAFLLLFSPVISSGIPDGDWNRTFGSSDVNLEWQKALGGSDSDIAYSIQPTTDYGYIMVGGTRSNDGDVSGNHYAGLSDFWVVKLDAVGSMQWQKCLGGGSEDYASSVQHTTDGGYIVAGYTGSYDGDISGHHGGYDFWVVKLDAVGSMQWQKCLGGSGMDHAYSIQQTADGGYVVAGDTDSNDGDVSGNHLGLYGNPSPDFWIVKLDSIGAIEWQKCLGGSSFDFARSIQQTGDGGYIVAGYTVSNDGDVSGYHGGYDFWIVKLDAVGSMQWQKCLGSSDLDYAYSIRQTNDEGYIVTGDSNYDNVFKLDSGGNIQWQKNVDGMQRSIQQTSDGGYIVAGRNDAIGSGDVWISWLDSSGTILDQANFGGTRLDGANCIQQTTGGSYIVAGGTGSNDGDVSGNHGGGDAWVVKLKLEDTPNTPPNTPSIPSGPSEGYAGTSYSYSTSATDPDGDQVKYTFDWRDDKPTTDTSYVDSGATGTASHSWSTAGTYKVTAMATDIKGATSEWSSPLEISISNSINIPSVTNGIGATLITTNSARLNGEIANTGNENPTVTVYYGTTDGGTNAGSWSSHSDLGIKGLGEFYADVTGLTPGTIYYYRCYASNSAGPSWASSTTTFKTITDLYSNLIFEKISLAPLDGTSLMLKKDATLTIAVKNIGSIQVPESDWNFKLIFTDVYLVGRDDLVTEISKKDNWVKEIDNIKLTINQLNPGESQTISYEFKPLDNTLADNSYLGFADRLEVWGKPNALPIDDDQWHYGRIDGLIINQNLIDQNARCLWDEFNLFFDLVLKKAIIKKFSEEGAEKAIECAIAVNRLFINFAANGIFGDRGPELLAQFFLDAGIKVLDLTFDTMIGFFKLLFFDAPQHCVGQFNMLWYNFMNLIDWASYNIAIWEIRSGTDLVMMTSSGERLSIINGLIENDISNSSAFLLPDGEVIMIANQNSLDIQIKCTNASTMKIACVVPIENRQSLYNYWSIPVIQGTILATAYSNISGVEPIKIDINGDGTYERTVFPELIKFEDHIIGISINKKATSAIGTPGSNVIFLINVTNIGNATLDKIKVVDTLPNGMQYVSDNRSGEVSSNTVAWNELSLDKGESIIIELVTQIGPEVFGNITNSVEAIGIGATEKQEEVSNSAYATIKVLQPRIKVEKTLGLPEPVQYGQYCENRKMTGTGVVDISTSIVDKKLALQYQNTMTGDGDIELESENALSEKSSKLQRTVGNNTTPLNLYEATKMTYSGKTPMTGEKSLQSKEFHGGIGANIQEVFSATEMEMDQHAFLASTDPASHITDRNMAAQLRNISAAYLVRFETKNRFNGTWGTDAFWHNIFYKDIVGHQMFTGKFEAEKTIRFHEDPTPEQIHVACEGIDC